MCILIIGNRWLINHIKWVSKALYIYIYFLKYAIFNVVWFRYKLKLSKNREEMLWSVCMHVEQKRHNHIVMHAYTKMREFKTFYANNLKVFAMTTNVSKMLSQLPSIKWKTTSKIWRICHILINIKRTSQRQIYNIR